MKIEVPDLDLTDQKYKTIDLNRRELRLRSKIKALNVEDLILKIKRHILPSNIKSHLISCTEGERNIVLNSN